MSAAVLVLIAGVVIVLGAIGLAAFAMGTLDQQAIIQRERSLIRHAGFRAAVFNPLDRLLLRAAPVRKLQQLMKEADVRRIRVSEFILGMTVISLLVAYVLDKIMAVHWALLLGAGVFACSIYVLTILHRRQYEKIVAQLPEFARILASTTGAGLSIHTALHIAGSELPDPAGREIRILSRELDMGTPLDVAFERLRDRVPGRDLGVLVSTLVISHRSGGSLISALRDLSFTLETRKETSREVRTIVAESSYTGYMVAGMGITLLALLTMFNNRVLHDMTSSIVGQIVLVAVCGAYVLGIVLINRLTRVKL
ncbi:MULTISPECIES: type II secretion system F family protein [unclassified Brevibacterium]|uniref:type II secretion system F family protein n=1 Tax=unclassified Brevibacterium TaxID=2614124 RepID=UPI0008A32FB4|nr:MULTISPECIES: type II secretion system F family protein [unclassified Brevibacterium]OFL68802.1 hypothetical protein HMPREF2757_07815 [Brevibacterium sp. HMSC063G07]OFS25567.1 hypothetical protein HMPREF3162_08295 [Brevibacterium sp. HMSC07C04]